MHGNRGTSMNTIDLDAVLALPVTDRIRLAETIWSSVARDASKLPIPEWQATELDRRLADHEQNKRAGLSWSEVKRRVTRAR